LTLEPKAIEALAPDQGSLKAGLGLVKPASLGNWSNVGTSPDAALIWGECVGSAANPYRVMADLRDLGNKCTCPSRKFPCKHVIGLLWMKAQALRPFTPVGTPADVPQWVTDWLGRRRPAAKARADGDAAPARFGFGAVPKDIGAALAPDAAETAAAGDAQAADPQAAARREAAAARRAAEVERAVLDALAALESWIVDQLRQGLAGFIDDVGARCRRIAARLVDGKAQALAARVDELPARLLALPGGERARGAVVELGRLVLLARAFRATPADPDIRRAVVGTESREALLARPHSHPDPQRVVGLWEVLADLIETRRDGLVSQTVWLLHLGAQTPRFALLLDFFPASAGRRASGFGAGERFAGELVFYPGRQPLRAVLIQRETVADDVAWPEAPDTREPLEQALAAPRLAQPWVQDWPLLLPPGRIARDAAGQPWWRARDDGLALPLAGPVPDLLLGTELTRAAALWSGARLQLLAAQTPWGRLHA
jgi:hypothetical protein